MLKFAVAGVCLALATCASSAQTVVAPAQRCLDCRDQSREGQSVKETENTTPAPSPACSDCPLPKGFDSQEVIKNVRTIDHSKVINTITVVPAGPRGKATRHLIIHLNETRHVGVIQHNHTIIEKTIRNVRRPQRSKKHHRVPVRYESIWRQTGQVLTGRGTASYAGRGCVTAYIPNGWTWSRISDC
jgi:hypothetical protein